MSSLNSVLIAFFIVIICKKKKKITSNFWVKYVSYSIFVSAVYKQY